LGKLKDRKDLMAVLAEVYPKFKHFHRVQNSGQIWAFVHRMSPGDWVCVPSKRKTIHVGEITGQYTFVADQWCPRLIVSAKWAWASAGTYMHPAEPVGRPLAHGPLIQRRAGGGRRSDNPLAPPASLLVWRIFAKPLY
ncbi:MAG TPA: hypothetical protein PLL20_14900, partial [Phycisphaerae bacterium]|nr:hypothetical protein [Phycisphaerae bacterium]HRR84329.1 hypothetical protein [Phycisphaerae bacterium]